jgi:hypothetical protein
MPNNNRPDSIIFRFLVIKGLVKKRGSVAPCSEYEYVCSSTKHHFLDQLLTTRNMAKPHRRYVKQKSVVNFFMHII